MKIELNREILTSKSTIGDLLVDGEFQCYTLEDPVREIDGVPVDQWKIAGDTAIPKGTYNVTITMSNRFKKLLPLLEGVPGFAGVRIHSGNTAADTEGCVLVGTVKDTDVVLHSRDAFEPLYDKIKAALYAGEKVELTIT